MIWEREFRQVKELEGRGSKHVVRCLSHDGNPNESYKLLTNDEFVEFNKDGSVWRYGEIRTDQEVVCHKDFIGRDLPMLDQMMITKIIKQAFKQAKQEGK